MTTVGYGDFYPKTHLGRTVAVIAAVLGSLFVSLMVVAMSESSTLNPPEQRVSKIILARITLAGLYEVPKNRRVEIYAELIEKSNRCCL